MHEGVAAERNPDVRRAWRDRAEEEQVAHRDVLGLHRFPFPVLLLHIARQGDAVLPEDVLREAAAIEAVGIAPAVAIGSPAEPKRRSCEGIGVEDWGTGLGWRIF